MKFKKGDRVEWTHPIDGKKFLGTVVEDANGDKAGVYIDGSYNIFSSIGAFYLNTDCLTLLVQTPFTKPPVHTYTIPKFVSALEENSKFKPLYSNTNTCTHEFKTYTGLTKKYEYCTKCDVKKNERGAYE